MDPISSSEINALYTSAAMNADASTAAAQVKEVQDLVQNICTANPKEVNTNTLLQRAIEVATAQAEQARAKANAAKAIMEMDAKAIADAKAYITQCEQNLEAAKNKLAADQAEYLRINGSLPDLTQAVATSTTNAAASQYQAYIASITASLTADQQTIASSLQAILNDPSKSVDERKAAALKFIQDIEPDISPEEAEQNLAAAQADLAAAQAAYTAKNADLSAENATFNALFIQMQQLASQRSGIEAQRNADYLDAQNTFLKSASSSFETEIQQVTGQSAENFVRSLTSAIGDTQDTTIAMNRIQSAFPSVTNLSSLYLITELVSNIVNINARYATRFTQINNAIAQKQQEITQEQLTLDQINLDLTNLSARITQDQQSISTITNMLQSYAIVESLKNIYDAYLISSMIQGATSQDIASKMAQASALVQAAEADATAKEEDLTEKELQYTAAQQALNQAGGEEALANVNAQIEANRVTFEASPAYQNWVAAQQNLDTFCTQNGSTLDFYGLTAQDFKDYLHTLTTTTTSSTQALTTLKNYLISIHQITTSTEDYYTKIYHAGQAYLSAYFNMKELGFDQVNNSLIAQRDQIQSLIDAKTAASTAYTSATVAYNEAVRHFNAINAIYEQTNVAYVIASTALEDAQMNAQILQTETIPSDERAITTAQANLAAAQAVNLTALQVAAQRSAAEYARLDRFATNKERVLTLLQNLATNHLGLYGGGSKFLPKGRSIRDIRNRI